ncbi:hypothetical protein ACMFMF_007003 [Clarireedia jacksonii]
MSSTIKMSSHLGPKDEIQIEPANSLQRHRTNISLGEISVDDLRFLNEEQAAGNPAKEYTKSPKDKDLLNRFQVFSIIANRMMGTGIFETPTIIIQQDRNVGGSLFLWVIGCIASMAGTLMYVEYGLTIPRRRMNADVQAVPRSGGELNYLKHLLPHPKFLAVCLFGFIFVIIGNSAANCVSFAVHVLAAAGHNNPKTGVVQAIALGAAWLVTLLHALGRMAGIHLNSAFAVTKISMLVMMIVLGFVVLNNHTGSMQRDPLSYSNLDVKSSFRPLGKVDNARGFATGYLNIVFTFGGFNQANYDGDFQYKPTIIEQFFMSTIGQAWNNKGALRLMNACVAVSSLGNVIVTTFTAARVKQEIAKEGILPYSLLFAKNINIIEHLTQKFSRRPSPPLPNPNSSSPTPSTHTHSTQFEPIPLPALTLHCLFSSILILASIRIPHPAAAYPFLVGIYTYTIDALSNSCLSLGLILMRLRASSPWNTYSKSNRWFSLCTAVIVFIANAFPVAALWIPEPPLAQARKGSATGAGDVPWYMVPTIGWALVLAGIIYWIGFVYGVPVFRKGAVLEVKRDPVIGVDDEGLFVQYGEMVYQKWAVPEEKEEEEENSGNGRRRERED